MLPSDGTPHRRRGAACQPSSSRRCDGRRERRRSMAFLKDVGPPKGATKGRVSPGVRNFSQLPWNETIVIPTICRWRYRCETCFEVWYGRSTRTRIDGIGDSPPFGLALRRVRRKIRRRGDRTGRRRGGWGPTGRGRRVCERHAFTRLPNIATCTRQRVHHG